MEPFWCWGQLFSRDNPFLPKKVKEKNIKTNISNMTSTFQIIPGYREFWSLVFVNKPSEFQNKEAYWDFWSQTFTGSCGGARKCLRIICPKNILKLIYHLGNLSFIHRLDVILLCILSYPSDTDDFWTHKLMWFSFLLWTKWFACNNVFIL